MIHLYRLDFESFFYILIWISVGYKGAESPKSSDPLRNWRRGDWLSIFEVKENFFIKSDKYEVIKGYLKDEYDAPKNLLTPFYFFLSDAFSAGNAAYNAVCKAKTGDSEDAQKASDKMLGEMITWDKAKHMFHKELETISDADQPGFT